MQFQGAKVVLFLLSMETCASLTSAFTIVILISYRSNNVLKRKQSSETFASSFFALLFKKLPFADFMDWMLSRDTLTGLPSAFKVVIRPSKK